MSYLKCPLCGRGVALNHFDPSNYDMDVYAFSMRGLGRGRGFEKTEEFSILDSDEETMVLIKDRILNLSKLFIDHDQLAEKEVLSALNIQTVNPRILAKKDNVIEDLSEEVVNLKSSVNERDRSLQKKDSIIEDLSDKNVELNRKASSYLSKFKNRDRLVEDLTESNINLKGEVSSLEEELEHRIGQAKKLLRIAKNQKYKIETLEEQVEELSEGLI